MKHSVLVVLTTVFSSFLGTSSALTDKCVRGSDTTDDLSFLVCEFCAAPALVLTGEEATSKATIQDLCANVADDSSAGIMAASVLEYGSLQGYYWENNTLAQTCVQHLFQYMPRRDTMLMFNNLDVFLEFLFEHVRFAILGRTKGPTFTKDIPLDIFLDYVVPFTFLNEKRDLSWRWRPRFFQALHGPVWTASNITGAMHILASLLPSVAGNGVLQVDEKPVPGEVIQWESETSPMNLSPQQVQLHHGSCTGTAITMAAAARAVGIPIRIAGCSQSIEGDDHHWTEFFDPATPDGPFAYAKHWHTKEGTSSGNAGGPWDGLSGPMEKCLAYLVPKDPRRLNTVWASQYSGPANMPLQWGKSPFLMKFGRIGAVNRCGDYCQTFGCGANRTKRWTQSECGTEF
jgi:hypothetical protein|eukprot:Stramenopile-MAST_4_protein_680